MIQIKKILKTAFLLTFITLSSLYTLAFAQGEGMAELVNRMPEGCGNQGISFLNGQIILGNQDDPLSQQVYFIHNSSDYTQLLLAHPTTSPMSAGWTSRLDEGQWSVLTLSGAPFNLTCFGRKPGAIGYVSCESVLTVCSYPSAKSDSSAGNYWLSENKAFSDTLNTLNNRGITLPTK